MPLLVAPTPLFKNTWSLQGGSTAGGERAGGAGGWRRGGRLAAGRAGGQPAACVVSAALTAQAEADQDAGQHAAASGRSGRSPAVAA